MKDLMPIGDGKNDAFSRILAFYQDENEAPLSADDDNILTRWCHCNTLIKSRKHKTAEIISMMCEKFPISKFTAEKDIGQTYALFGQVAAMNKQHVVKHTIENIDFDIQRFLSDKSLVHLVPKLYQEKARFVAMLSDEVAKRKVEIPNVFIGSLTINNNNGDNSITAKDAEAKFQQMKKDLKDDDYLDSEDIPQ